MYVGLGKARYMVHPLAFGSRFSRASQGNLTPLLSALRITLVYDNIESVIRI